MNTSERHFGESFSVVALYLSERSPFYSVVYLPDHEPFLSTPIYWPDRDLFYVVTLYFPSRVPFVFLLFIFLAVLQFVFCLSILLVVIHFVLLLLIFLVMGRFLNPRILQYETHCCHLTVTNSCIWRIFTKFSCLPI